MKLIRDFIYFAGHYNVITVEVFNSAISVTAHHPRFCWRLARKREDILKALQDNKEQK